MTGPPDETARERTDGVARIWQLYADEIGLPDPKTAAPAGSTPPRASVPSTPAQRRPRRNGVRLGVATVTAMVAAALLVIGLAPQIPRLLGARADRTRSSEGDPVKRADADLRAAATPSPSDERPTVPVSVSAPGDADPGRAAQPPVDVEYPSTSAIRPGVSPDAGATPDHVRFWFRRSHGRVAAHTARDRCRDEGQSRLARHDRGTHRQPRPVGVQHGALRAAGPSR